MAQAVIRRWGNSAAVRLPAAVLAASHITVDTPVEIEVRDGSVVITPQRPQPTLDALLAAITPDSLHGEVDWGGPVGREVW